MIFISKMIFFSQYQSFRGPKVIHPLFVFYSVTHRDHKHSVTHTQGSFTEYDPHRAPELRFMFNLINLLGGPK